MSRYNLSNLARCVQAFTVAMATSGAPSVWAAKPQSESPKTPSVTLDVLVVEVLAKNPELDFYRAEITAATGERRTAAARINPDLSTSLGDKRTSGPLVSDGLVWAVSAQQTFEWPGRIPLRKAIADQQIKLAELGLEQFRAALAPRTRLLAFHLLDALEKASAVREVANRFRALRGVLVQRDPAGLTPLLKPESSRPRN